jgi:rhodanese-related sulfurtransferase
MIELIKNRGFIIQGILHVSPKETYGLCREGAIIVDVREIYLSSFKSFEVEKVIHLPAGNIEKEYKNLPDDVCLIFADSAGIHSKQVVLFLKDKGFDNIANMAGGLIEWERDGLPVKTDTAERLTGSCMCQLRRWEKNNLK